MEREPTRLTIDLTPDAEPIAGRIESMGGESREFAGYMGLIAALDALTSRPATDPTHGGTGSASVSDARRVRR
jgi:hypothetical protein